jgi:hypothetical protein
MSIFSNVSPPFISGGKMQAAGDQPGQIERTVASVSGNAYTQSSISDWTTFVTLGISPIIRSVKL